MKSFEIFHENTEKINSERFAKAGNQAYDDFISFAGSEGYKGDGYIYGLVTTELEKNGDVVVLFCHALRTFDLVEVAFIFPNQSVSVDGKKWFGGYLHTLCVTRKDDIETHPATILTNEDGNIIIADWLSDTVFVRGCDREVVISQTITPTLRAWQQSQNLLNLIAASATETITDPANELRKCHISKSSIDGICEIFDACANPSRLQLCTACSEYASKLDFSAGEKYLQTAGRILRMK